MYAPGLPILWWTDFALVVGLLAEAYMRRREPWARPAAAVYITVAVWYLGDVAYNSMQRLLEQFAEEIIATGFVQVGGFLICLRLMIGMTWPRRAVIDPASDRRIAFSDIAMTQFLYAVAFAWVVVVLMGLPNAEWDLIGVLWPPLRDYRPPLFGHSGFGAGADFLFAAGGYIHIALCSAMGVGFALSKGYVRLGFGFLMALAWPYILFDRARNVMLATVVPGIITYGLFGRGAPMIRAGVLVSCVIVINAWLLLVGANRDVGVGVLGLGGDWHGTIDVPVALGIADRSEAERHLGLDMFLELSYLNTFLADGTYEPNMGQRYLSEILNVVPRTFWSDKPTIGIDYSIARGFESVLAEGTGVATTVSTGMIGQGLANFGRWFGPVVAAALMAGWVKILGMLWLQRTSLLRLGLFVLGMALTFNMGRDITLLVLWPFVFAYLAVRIVEYRGAMRNRPAGKR